MATQGGDTLSQSVAELDRRLGQFSASATQGHASASMATTASTSQQATTTSSTATTRVAQRYGSFDASMLQEGMPQSVHRVGSIASVPSTGALMSGSTPTTAAELQQLMTRVAKLETDAALARSEVTATQAAASEAATRVREHEEVNHQLAKRLMELQAGLGDDADVATENTELRSQVHQLRQQLNHSQDDVMNLKAKNDEARQVLLSAQLREQQQQAELRIAQGRVERAKQSLSQRTSRNRLGVLRESSGASVASSTDGFDLSGLAEELGMDEDVEAWSDEDLKSTKRTNLMGSARASANRGAASAPSSHGTAAGSGTRTTPTTAAATTSTTYMSPTRQSRYTTTHSRSSPTTAAARNTSTTNGSPASTNTPSPRPPRSPRPARATASYSSRTQRPGSSGGLVVGSDSIGIATPRSATDDAAQAYVPGVAAMDALHDVHRRTQSQQQHHHRHSSATTASASYVNGTSAGAGAGAGAGASAGVSGAVSGLGVDVGEAPTAASAWGDMVATPTPTRRRGEDETPRGLQLRSTRKSEAQQRLQRLVDNLRDTEDELTAKNHQLTSAADEIADVMSTRDAALQRAAAAESKVDEQDKEIARLKALLAEQQHATATLEERLDHATQREGAAVELCTTREAELQQAVEELTTRVSNAETHLRETTTKLRSTETALDVQLGKVKRREDTIHKARARVKGLLSDREFLRKKVTNLEAELAKMQQAAKVAAAGYDAQYAQLEALATRKHKESVLELEAERQRQREREAEAEAAAQRAKERELELMRRTLDSTAEERYQAQVRELIKDRQGLQRRLDVMAAALSKAEALVVQLREQMHDELEAQARLLRAKEVENEYILQKLHAKYDAEAHRDDSRSGGGGGGGGGSATASTASAASRHRYHHHRSHRHHHHHHHGGGGGVTNNASSAPRYSSTAGAGAGGMLLHGY